MDEGDKERERGGEREREGARKGERERPRIGVREGGGRERGRREAEAERLAADCHSPASRHPVDWCRQGREGRRNDGRGLRIRARGGFGACHCRPAVVDRNSRNSRNDRSLLRWPARDSLPQRARGDTDTAAGRRPVGIEAARGGGGCRGSDGELPGAGALALAESRLWIGTPWLDGACRVREGEHQ